MPILQWLDREKTIKQASKVPYRLLEIDQEFSYGDEDTGNMLIQGDNLEALKALLPYFAGKVKCIYIDPPYNTGNAFEHYADNLEHSKWLDMMYPRLELLRELLSEDGVIFIQIDDVEQPYLRVLMDEVFGRNNFINTIYIAGASGGGEDKKLKKNIEYIHLYAKRYLAFSSFKGVHDYVPISELVQSYIEEGKSWKYTTALVYEGDKEYIGSTVDGDGNEIKIYSRKNPIIKSIKQIMKDEGLSETVAYQTYANKIFQTAMPQSSIRPRVIKKVIELGSQEDLHSIEYIPKTGKNKGQLYEQFYKGNKFRLFAWLRDVSEEKDGQLCKKEAQGTYWNFTSETKNLTKEGNVSLPNGKKPERLIHRILTLATNENDLILDSFLGSGTTAAVAHKMNRRWIGIEMGEHAKTHCAARLQKVIDGEQGGISKDVNWQGGGGFRFYNLGESIFDQDDV
jgi:adenine-specific DNA-methyltransferase